MKRIISILMLAALTQAIAAQQELSFTSLDWNEMQIDSVLPVYTEVVPLESDYRTHSYTVSLLYPEFAALSAKESLVAERFAAGCDNLFLPLQVFYRRAAGLLCHCN